MMRIDQSVLLRLLCALAVATVMIPVGTAVFPYVSDALDGTQFQVLEAVISAALGFGIYAQVA